MIIWRGISRIDGVTPVAVVMTGTDKASGNAKTGAMVQCYILVDAVKPVEAVRAGKDAAICGDCYHRGDASVGRKRTCYVSMATGLNVVGRKLVAGEYPEVSLSEASRLVAGRMVRVGTYGDPAAVPFAVWKRLLKRAAGWTGYTHQWRKAGSLRGLLMASVDTAEERTEARKMGWRTFRVLSVRDGALEAKGEWEIACPASAEAGHRVTCEECRLCAGTSRAAKDIAIVDHSRTGAAAVRRLTVLA